jgi:hypothetical protein
LFRERFAQFVHPELLGSLLEYLPHTHPSPHVSVTGIRHRMSASHESVRMAACVCVCVSVLECCDNSISQRHARPKRKMCSYHCAVGSTRTHI